MHKPTFALLPVVLLLNACGVEVATTTATTAELQSQQVEAARQTEAQIKQKLDEAMQATNAAAASAAVAEQ